MGIVEARRLPHANTALHKEEVVKTEFKYWAVVRTLLVAKEFSSYDSEKSR